MQHQYQPSYKYICASERCLLISQNVFLKHVFSHPPSPLPGSYCYSKRVCRSSPIHKDKSLRIILKIDDLNVIFTEGSHRLKLENLYFSSVLPLLFLDSQMLNLHNGGKHTYPEETWMTGRIKLCQIHYNYF